MRPTTRRDSVPMPSNDDADNDNVANVDNAANADEPEANPDNATVNDLERDDDADWNEPNEQGDDDEDPFQRFVGE